jgi:hypothetical protein
MKNVTINTTYWRNGDIYYMIIFTYFLEWRHNKASYGQHFGHLGKKTICSNKKVNEDEHKHKEM